MLEETEIAESEKAFVRAWTERVVQARKRWEPDFQRMRDDMEFAAGFQWPGQQQLQDERYMANGLVYHINSKVASLYARDPQIEARRRDRLDFQIWDGRLETVEMARAVLGMPGVGAEIALPARALLTDYANGRMQKDMVRKVGKTTEILYQWQTDNQQPPFKLQLKQLVRRVVTCGVGYTRLSYSRQGVGPAPSTSDVEESIEARIRRINSLSSKLLEGEFNEENQAHVETLRILSQSLQTSVEAGELEDVQERLLFDFLPATSVIPDTNCRALKGFIGASWIAIQYLMPLEDANAEWGVRLDEGDFSGEVRYYTENGILDALAPYDGEAEGQKIVCLFEVFDKKSKSRFVLCDGYKGFVLPPEDVWPQTKHFWQVHALTFNDVEVESSCKKATIFPPSDVHLLRSVQLERNRSRDALRAHRKANAPRYFYPKGTALTDEDVAKIATGLPHQVIGLDGVPPGTKTEDIVSPFKPAAVDPFLYETNSLQDDTRVTVGTQEGPLPASTRGTATAATLNEQARNIATSSNVDDLDDHLSILAECGGEMLMRECPYDVVQRVVGLGAVWPQEDTNRAAFVDEIYLSVKAASSGRPNKALDLSNWQIVAPILQAAGVDLVWLASETMKRVDDYLSIDDAFPNGRPQPQPLSLSQQPQNGQPKHNGGSGASRQNQTPRSTQQEEMPETSEATTR